jgi:hypothetical protein
MKTLFKTFLSGLLVLCVSCLFTSQGVAQNKDGAFGEAITETNPTEASKLVAMLKDKKTLEIKLKGTIIQTCKKKGCWMEMDLGNGKKMRVKFKDYAFFVPKDASAHGKVAIIEGVAQKETIDVKTLRHYAKDAGKSEAEIEKITKPEDELTFEAKGVIIKDLK